MRAGSWLLLKESEQREQRVPEISLRLVHRPEKSVQMHYGSFTERFVSAELIAEDWETLKVESLQILLKLWLKVPCFGSRWGAWGGTAGGAASSSPPAALLMFPGPSGNCKGAYVLLASASMMFKATLMPSLSAGNIWGKSFESKTCTL